MSIPLWIEQNSLDDLPSVEDIQRLVTRQQHLVLLFPAVASGEEIHAKQRKVIETLSRMLPDCTVFDSTGKEGFISITVKQVIGEQTVLSYADTIVGAARQFRAVATMLTRTLTKRLDTSVEAFADKLFRFRLSYDAYRGTLEEGWHYGFHGYECRFENERTGQVLEVRLGFGTEFGVLSPYFFHQFIGSTPEFEPLVSVLQDAFHDTARALQVLEQKGLLRLVASEDGRRGSVASD